MSNVSHLAQGQLQQGQKPHIPTLIISPFLLGFYTSVLQTYSSLAEIVSEDRTIHLLVWSFPFALFAGKERKKAQSSMVDGGREPIYLFGTTFLCSPIPLQSPRSRDSLGWIALSRAGSCSSPCPSSLPRQKTALLPWFVCACLYTCFNDVSHYSKDRPDLRELLHCS